MGKNVSIAVFDSHFLNPGKDILMKIGHLRNPLQRETEKDRQRGREREREDTEKQSGRERTER